MDWRNIMRVLKACCLFIIFTLLISGCSDKEQKNTLTNKKMTIEPYDLSEKETLLISKTDVGYIEFFKLNGSLTDEDDLQFSVEVYENGTFKEELLKSWDAPETKYKDSILSFGISAIKEENKSFKLINGIPSGLATTNYPNNMTSSSFSRLVDKKVTLEINKPIYLAVWQGTTKNVLHSVGSENGELPEGLDETELAFLYKVLLSNKEKVSDK